MELLASYCLTEPGSGSDAAALTTRAVRDGDHYVLNGQKQFISGAGAGDLYVVMARTGGDGPGGISTLVVPGDAAGLSFGANERKMGWNAQPTRAVIFENVRVPVANRLGEEGIGFKIAMAGARRRPHQYRGLLARRRAGGAGKIAGLHEGAQGVRQTPRRIPGAAVPSRRHGDRTRGVAGLVVARGGGARPQGCRTPPCFAPWPSVSSPMPGFDVANQALQLHGGYGYLTEYGIEKIVRDLRVHQILEGTNEIMRLIVARSLVGR